MSPVHPAKNILLVLLSLLCFTAADLKAQQGAPVKGVGAGSASTQAGPSTAAPSASPAQDRGPGSSRDLLKEDSIKPSLPGAQTLVLTDDQKIPERANSFYEDWSKPVLTPGMQTDIEPMAKSDSYEFTRELVHVQWRELDPINLWVIKPAGVSNPPVILYLYSYPSSNDRYKNDEFCKFVTKNGFAAIGFVSALTEQRFHDRPMKDWFVSQLQESLGSSVHDVQMILNYLAGRGDFDMTRAGMWADGSGASIAIMAAAVDPRIKVLDLLDPWGDWPDWLAKSSLVPEKERANYLKPEFLRRVENLDPVKLLPQLKTQQVRLQSIEEGVTVTPDIVRERVEAAAPANATIVHYQNTKEFVTSVASVGKGFDWIKERVAAAAWLDTSIQTMTKASPEVKTSAQ